MKKIILKGFIPVLTAILIFYQAVFLFSAKTNAQTTSIETDTTISSTTIVPVETNTTITSDTTTINAIIDDTTTIVKTDDQTITSPTQTTISAGNTDAVTTEEPTTLNITPTTTKTTTIIATDEPSTTQSFYISFVENLQSPFSGDQPITIYTNQKADNVFLSISGAQQAKLNGFRVDEFHYRFNWSTKTFPNGQYKIVAAATKGADYVSKSFTTEVKNTTNADSQTDSLKNTTQSITATTSTTLIKPTDITTTTPTKIEISDSSLELSPDVEENKTDTTTIEKSINETLIKETIINNTILNNVPASSSLEKEVGDVLKIEEIKNIDNQPSSFQNIKQDIAAQKMPEECQKINAKSLTECETLMREKYIPQECIALGITTKENCQKIMTTKYGRPTQCTELSEEGCQKLEKDIILSNFVNTATLIQANKEIKNIIGKNIRIQNEENKPTKIIVSQSANELEKTSDSLDTIKNIIPLAKNNKDAGLLVLETKDSPEKKYSAVSAVLLLDSDGDGLTDDMEKRLGTNPNIADSDGDGFSDREEIANNYNPLGDGSSTKTLSPIEKAIIKKTNIEQPKNSGEENTSLLKIKKVAGIKIANQKNKEEILKIEGQAEADTIVSLFIYSAMPIVVTVKTDKNGNWNYELDKTLIDGKHEVYVVVNDGDGKITTKSAPFSFFIKEAKAVDQDSYLQTEIASIDIVNTMIYWYIAFGALLITFGVSFYALYSKKLT